MCDARCTGLAYKSTVSFKQLLSDDIMFNIVCGAGEAAEADIKSKHDWVRTVLIYKFGERGLLRALERIGNQPITEMSNRSGQKIWKNYNAVYVWMKCLNDRANILPMVRCGCLSME